MRKRKTIWVNPKDLETVVLNENGVRIKFKKGGNQVTASTFHRRRINDGDLVVMPTPPEKPAKKQAGG